MTATSAARRGRVEAVQLEGQARLTIGPERRISTIVLGTAMVLVCACGLLGTWSVLPDALKDGAGVALFVLLGSVGFTVFALIAGFQVAWTANGRESFAIHGDALVWRRSLFGMAVSRSYRVTDIESAQVVERMRAAKGRRYPVRKLELVVLGRVVRTWAALSTDEATVATDWIRATLPRSGG